MSKQIDNYLEQLKEVSIHPFQQRKFQKKMYDVRVIECQRTFKNDKEKLEACLARAKAMLKGKPTYISDK